MPIMPLIAKMVVTIHTFQTDAESLSRDLQDT